jgi:hypothetical protein
VFTWKCTVKQAGSAPSSAIGSVLESMPGSVLENLLIGVLGRVLGVYLGAYCQAGWECHRVQLREYLTAYSGVCLRES